MTGENIVINFNNFYTDRDVLRPTEKILSAVCVRRNKTVKTSWRHVEIRR